MFPEVINQSPDQMNAPPVEDTKVLHSLLRATDYRTSIFDGT